MSASQLIEQRRADGILLLRLNRPEQRNAINEQLQQELTEALFDVAAAREVRGIILWIADGRGACCRVDGCGAGPPGRCAAERTPVLSSREASADAGLQRRHGKWTRGREPGGHHKPLAGCR